MPKLSTVDYRRIGASEQVIQWVSEGVKLPFRSIPELCQFENRIYSQKHKQFVNAEIQKYMYIGSFLCTQKE